MKVFVKTINLDRDVSLVNFTSSLEMTFSEYVSVISYFKNQ